jgi:hypothetical protein
MDMKPTRFREIIGILRVEAADRGVLIPPGCRAYLLTGQNWLAFWCVGHCDREGRLSTRFAACVLVAVATAWSAGPAKALSLAVAKKCLELTMKEYPRPKSYAAYKPGHTGTAKAREDYYRNCVAKEGNIVTAEPR